MFVSGGPTFVVSLLEMKDDLVYEIPIVILNTLKEFQDKMPLELPYTLLPR